MTARSMLVGGTASHAGKSWMTTAICRYLRRRGLRVAPFKAQNMSLNSYPCHGGGEIGRAQVVQAAACGLDPEVDMNPILLKPNGESSCQVVLNGRVWRNLGAGEYREHFAELLDCVLDAYERMAQRYDYIVMEGAGSVAEVNLRSTDLVNFGLALRTRSPVLLVADIDRGGVFASVLGSVMLLEPCEQELLRGFAINRFRGDRGLFESGVEFLENRTTKKCLGVFPHAPDVEIDAEDSVSLENVANSPGARVAVIRLPRISNFTDFRLLRDITWVTSPLPERFDWVILPGTKNTIADLEWMRERRLDRWVLEQHAAGASVLGICGGYQILGERIEDPEGVESGRGAADGLGLLPVATTLQPEKITRAVTACLPSGASFRAYEIHMGRTDRPAGCEPFATSEFGEDGIRHERCFGTYLHGALECAGVAEEILGIKVAPAPPAEQNYERLADWFEANCDLPAFEELYL